MKIDSVFTLPCECGHCAFPSDEEEGNYFSCEGCLADAPYCLGQDDDWYEYCTPCFHELTNNLTTVVIQKPKPNIYMNC